ncbi:MAG TPA: YetF domain-containing protein [Verrucomicrobiae bacterium]|nr:YetF domain-containing protein [Verrucomicrobiae bacterium]
MWQLSVPWWEFVVRALIIYGFLIVLLRLTGRRQVGQLSPFDLVLLLVLSNSVQNAMNAGDNSVLAGVISACSLVAANYLVGLATYKNKKAEALVEGRPEVLIHNGKLYEDVMTRERLTHHELNAALRAAGCTDAHDVHYAVLENNGNISVVAKKDVVGAAASADHSPPLN